jgi:hypothetical protein
MTLERWSQFSGISPKTHPSGATYVVVVCPCSRHLLYRLTDDKVSTVSGPVVWLVPVKQEEASNG